MNKNITSDVALKAVKVRSQPPPEKRASSVSRRLSRQESTRSNSGSEIFYGDSPVSIPFRWESTPGTPKVDLGERRPMPPLTPPPSYLSSPARLSVKKHHYEAGNIYSRYSHAGSNTRILQNVLPKLNLKKKSTSNSNSSSSLSSSSYSSSSSVSSSPWSSARSARSTPSTPEPAGGPRRKLAYHLRRKEEDEEEEEEEEEEEVEDGDCEESPMGNLCFGIPGRNHSSKRGCSANFIKLLLKQHA